jgi:hypothetical protein
VRYNDEKDRGIEGGETRVSRTGGRKRGREGGREGGREDLVRRPCSGRQGECRGKRRI